MKIHDAVIKVANGNKTFKTKDVLTLLENKYSRQAVSTTINRLVEKGSLLRSGKGPSTHYGLAANATALANSIKLSFLTKGLAEHEVLMQIKEDKNFWRNIPENLDSIFSYAFSEMLNNAIDHSQDKKVAIKVVKSDKKLWFEVRDMGVGVFRNIMKKRKLNSELEAIQDLLKGKTTTAPKAHSGEGIFFTSKIADVFVLTSFNKKLLIDNNIEDLFLEEQMPSLKGTQVTFEINLNTKKHLSDVFRKYQSDPDTYAFDTTEIQIKLYKSGTIYVSRSQAKRILFGLEKFRKIILDFDQVPTVGQAFADEVFRVFQTKHPDIEIKSINMIEPVAFMVGRVEKP